MKSKPRTHTPKLLKYTILSLSAIAPTAVFATEDPCDKRQGGHQNAGFIICKEKIDIPSLALDTNGFVRNASTLTLTGSHHRTLIDHAAGRKGIVTWVTGDFAHFSELDADQESGEIGFSHDFGIQNMRFGFAIGYSNMNQDLPFGGDSDSDGNFVLAEVDYDVPDSPLVLSALAYYGEWDMDIKRGYPGSSSRGSTDADTFALRLRADWVGCYEVAGFSLTPRIAYTLIHSGTDGYTETGGGLPASFDGQSSTDHEIRAGIDADYQLGTNTSLRGILEVVKRFNDDSNASGVLPGNVPFKVNIDNPESFWGRLGLEITHNLNESQQLSFSVFGSTDGADPSVSGAISFSMGF